MDPPELASVADIRAAAIRVAHRLARAEERGVALVLSDQRDIRLLLAAVELAYGKEGPKGEGP